MKDEQAKASKPAPLATLEQKIMDCCLPKSEAEWWAHRRIKELEEELTRRATPAPMSDDALVALCRKIPLHGDAGCDKLTDDEWRAVLSTVRPTIEAAAREDERARVVTMFRERAEMRQHDDARSIFLFWADAIERGEHRENGDG